VSEVLVSCFTHLSKQNKKPRRHDVSGSQTPAY